MKKNILAAFIPMLAVIAFFAFKPGPESGKKEVKAPPTTYVWFLVPAGSSIACGGTITPANVTGHPKTTTNPLADMTQYTLTREDALSNLSCAESTAFVCAVGYEVIASNFEQVGSTWKPKSTIAVASRICRATP